MGLKRVLGPVDAAWLVAGSMFGAGIFITPGLVAEQLPGLALPLAAWTLGGLLALCGAAIYGELGARMPRAGGDYRYLTEAFGPVWGFLTGWAALTITFSASAALMSIVACSHVLQALPEHVEVSPLLRTAGPPLLILLITLGNVAGARVAGWAAALFTAIPITGLYILFIAGWWFGGSTNSSPVLETVPAEASLAVFGAAMIPIFFTYTGWNAAAYVAGEIRAPERNLARGLLGGTLLITVIYVSINLLLLVVVPREELAGSSSAASLAAQHLLGPAAARVVSGLIAFAVLGSATVTLMAGARIYYAMARDGLAPRTLGKANAAGVPANALWISGLWTALLSLTGSVGQLLGWATLSILLLSSMTVASLSIHRRGRTPRPAYQCPAYPIVATVYIVASMAVAVASAMQDWRQALYGVLIVGAGIPVYWFARSRTDRR